MTPVDIVGAGPAGSAAAITARELGCAVRLFEKSPFPRHKVCGEFLSPEIFPVLESLGVSDAFLRARPARIARAEVHFGGRPKVWKLPQPAWGLSRYTLDHLLLQRALAAGAVLIRERWGPDRPPARLILAHGRQTRGRRRARLFGFKAHFSGPASDAIELFFRWGCYAGVNAVEDGITTVCGVAAEDLLRGADFDFDGFLDSWKPLATRLRGLGRRTEWLATGPLEPGGCSPPSGRAYLAGDALAFVDPFTGSGITSALMTGKLAATAAALDISVRDHALRCRRLMRGQFAVASVLRSAIEAGLAARLARFVPGELLFRSTRPPCLT